MDEKLYIKLIDPIVGKSSQIIVELLKDKKDVNEFRIAKKMTLTINQTRNLLYKLYSQNLVSFIRKKDRRKGWYIYFWTLNKHNVLELAKHQKEKELERLRHLLKSREDKRFFYCKTCGLELVEDNALHSNFLCPECGELLHVREDRSKAMDTAKEIDKIKKEITTVDNEIIKLKEETEKKAEKERRKKSKGKRKIKKTKKAEKSNKIKHKKPILKKKTKQKKKKR